MSEVQLKSSIGWLELANFASNPTDVIAGTGSPGIAFVGGVLKSYYNGAWSTVASGGGGSFSTWEDAYTADQTFTIPSGTWTIAGNHADSVDVLTLTNIGGGSGDVLQITNSGTGKDVNGTSSTWSVTKLGAAVFSGVSISGTASALATTGAAVWTLLDADTAALTIGSSGATSILKIVTSNGSEAVVFGNAVTVTDGLTALASTSNAAPVLTADNDTITTFGVNATEGAGMVVFSSDTITTGNLLRLELDESALAGGHFLKAVQTDAGATVFSVGENGVTTIAGAGAANAFVITAGDVVFSDASLAITDADDAASFTVTNNTATSASVVVLTGSGVHTGNTTSSFMKLTPSGMTTGTALYIAAAAATTSVAVVDLAVAALTSGSALRIVGATGVFTTGGKLIELSSTAAVAGNLLTATTDGAYTGTGMILVTAGAATTGVLVSVVSTTGLTSGSLIRATSSTAGAIATNGAISFVATGNFTSTARVGFFEVRANTTTSGTIAHIVGTAVTDGNVLILEAVEGTLTTGKYFTCYDGAAADFSIAKYGATVIAGNSSGTAALTLTAGDLVISSGLLSVSGLVTLTAGITGKVILAGTEDIAAGGTTTALSLTVSQHTIACDAGGDTFTLADGVNGQIMTILAKAVNGGTATITPATFAQGTSITFNAIGDSVMLQYATTTGWFIIGGNSYAIV